MKGSVKIQDEDQSLNSALYYSRRDRNLRFEDWKELYKDRFYDCFIQINPMVSDRINSRGMNCKDNEVAFTFGVFV